MSETNEAVDTAQTTVSDALNSTGINSITAFIEALPEDKQALARDLLSSPDRFLKHLKVYHEANAEARDRRKALESLWRTIGLEPPSREELTEISEILDYIMEGGEFHPERYKEVLVANEDDIVEMINEGEADPEDFGLVLDEETGELIPEYELESDEEDTGEIPEELESELYEREQKIAELEAKARQAELKAIALQHGVSPDRVDDFLKLYTPPEPATDEEGNEIPLDELQKKSFEQYREKYPIFFEGAMPEKKMVRTDGTPIPPSIKNAEALERAVQQGSVEDALKNAPTEKMTG